MENCSMCRRRLLVKLVNEGTYVAEAARLSGLSRTTAYKWLDRFRESDEAGLKDLSRARADPGVFEGPLAERLLALRRQHPTWGPRKLLAWMERRTDAELPVASTVHDLLKRHGLIIPRQPRTPRHQPFHYAGPTPTEPNARWTIDFKGDFRLGNGTKCYPLTLRDAASRRLLSIRAMTSTSSGPVQGELERRFRENGLPAELQSDNGTPFGTKGLSRLSKLSVWLLKLDVLPVLSRPAKPQDNGAHERMHRDLKAETTRPPAHGAAGQQRKFDAFLRVFNEERPHEALGYGVPDEHWRPSTREFPARLPQAEYPSWWEVRRVNAAASTMSWRDKAVKVNGALGGEDIAFEPIADGVWLVHFYRYPIGYFDERKLKLISLERESGRLSTKPKT